MPRNGRRWWRTTHLVLALVTGVPLVVVGATGAILGIAPELQRRVQPEFYAVEASGELLPVSELARRLRAAHPDVRLNHVMGYDDPTRAWTGWVSQNEGGSSRWFVLHIDPYTGRVAKDTTGGAWIGTVEQLHKSLGAGPIGREVVGVSSVALIVLSLTGIWLWWPLRRRTVSGAVRRRELLAWHNLTGLVLFPVLLAMAVTGVEMSWGPVVAPALDAVTGAPPIPSPPESRVIDGAPAITLPEAIAIVQRRFPGAVVRAFADAGDPEDPYAIHFGFSGDLNRYGWERAYIDRYSGALLAHVDAPAHSAGAMWRSAGWQLHGGEMFGTAGRWIWAIASAAVPALFITGLLVWWRRRTRRRAGPLRPQPRVEDEVLEPVEV